MSLPEQEIFKLQRAFSPKPGYKTSSGYTGNAKKRNYKKPPQSSKKRKIDHLSNKQRKELFDLQTQAIVLFEKHSNVTSKKTENKVTKKDVKDGLAADGIWSVSEWETYTRRVKTFLKFVYENHGIKNIKELKPKHVGEFLQSQIDKNNAAKTIGNYHSAIQKFAEFGGKSGLKSVGKIVNKHHKEMVPRYSKEQYRRGKKGGYDISDVQKMAWAAGKHFSLHHRNAIEVLGYCGPRIDEFLRIKWENVDFQNNKIWLVDDNQTKGARPRVVPVPEKVMKNLKEVFELGLHKTDDQNIWGDKMSENDARNLIKEVARLGGAKYSAAHDFRRAAVKYHEKQIKKELKRGDLNKEKIVENLLQFVNADPKLNPWEHKKEPKRDKNGKIMYRKSKDGNKYRKMVPMYDGNGNPVMGFRYTKEELMTRRIDYLKNMLVSQVLGHNRTDITAVYKS